MVFLLFCLILGVSSATACPIPVFQYALENWAADPYEIRIYHKGGLAGDSQKAFGMLKDAESGDENAANVNIEIRDLLKDSDAESPVDDDSLPYMQVRYPRHYPLRDPVWSGELSTAVVRSLLHSPARERLASLLLKRKAAVWVLLEGDDRAGNDAAAKRLESELSRLEKTLILPSSAEWEGQTVQIHDEISFDIIRLRRDDPNEAFLVDMLAASERDLAEFGAVPMAFPIYGRGLILYALVDKGINSWTIGDAGLFLTGPCSCQIKAGNPGLDLLLSVDWNKKVQPLAEQTFVSPVGTGGFIRGMEEAQKEFDDD